MRGAWLLGISGLTMAGCRCKGGLERGTALASAAGRPTITLVTRASATTALPLKKMSVCSSTEARPAICAFLQCGFG